MAKNSLKPTKVKPKKVLFDKPPRYKIIKRLPKGNKKLSNKSTDSPATLKKPMSILKSRKSKKDQYNTNSDSDPQSAYTKEAENGIGSQLNETSSYPSSESDLQSDESTVLMKKRRKKFTKMFAKPKNSRKTKRKRESSPSSDSEFDAPMAPSYSKISEALSLVPTFDGTSTTTVQDFIDQAKFAIGLVPPSQKHRLENLIQGKILGRAKIEIKDCMRSGIKEIFKRLLAVFSKEKTYFKLSSDLANLKQEDDESVASYGLRAKQVLRDFIEAAGSKHDKDIARGVIASAKINAPEHFINGLNKNLFTVFILFEEKFDDLEEAITAAERAEQKLENNKHKFHESQKNFLYRAT